MQEKWRCVLIGDETLLIECAQILEIRGHEIAAVVSDRNVISDWAKARGVLRLDRPARLADEGPAPFDYLFSIANLAILPDALLALPTKGAINFHDGPLPRYPGLNAPVRALLNQEPRHGITWHRMTGEVDRGAILATRQFAIDEGETAFSLNTKCFSAAMDSFAELVDALAGGTVVEVPQVGFPAASAAGPDRTAGAGAIQWQADGEAITTLVRALDFGTHANPVALPGAIFNGELVLVRQASLDVERSNLAPGTIVRVDPDALVVATGGSDLRIERFSTAQGEPLTADEASARYGMAPGSRFDELDDEKRVELGRIAAGFAVHEKHWRRRLAELEPALIGFAEHSADTTGSADHLDFAMTGRDVPGNAEIMLASIMAYLARINDKAVFDIGYCDPVLAMRVEGMERWFSSQLPVRVEVDFSAGLRALQDQLGATLRETHRRLGYRADLAARMTEFQGAASAHAGVLPVAVAIVDHFDGCAPPAGCEALIAIRSDGQSSRWFFDGGRIDRASIRAMQQGVAALRFNASADPGRPIGELPLLDPTEQARLFQRAQGLPVRWRQDATVHQLFGEQAQKTPMRPAVTCREESLTYQELDQRANRFARYLQRLGVGPDSLVALHCDRSPELLVALFGILKAGGAYVPLDPAYPAPRIRHMIEDSGVRIIVTRSHLAARLDAAGATVISIDGDWSAIEAEDTAPVTTTSGPANLAYVIYTSGSTGKPKGVMVEHRNVVNFFTGIDQHIAPEGNWLAVTSLSFDISVLELCWTLARGMHVVLATGDELRPAKPARRPVTFSLFYFASDEGSSAGEKYRLLLEGARFADRHGFTAVWTPERHFHAFGGLYPNPAVTGAAIAAITERVQIRGGSVVVPLHHPARVAEEWSVVDNLSNGRVGIAFASGWQPNDFVLRPESFADKGNGLFRDLETVRALWRGEARSFDGPAGPVEIRTLPRPVQPELPFWITSAGNADTFAAAGRAGASILTHLLGQSIDELAEKIRTYRDARRAAGHEGEGHVTLMLHSFVGPDSDEVRAVVREPLIAYLRTATSLVKQYAWSFPAFKRRPGMADSVASADLESLSADEMEMLLEHAFDRYFETSGLFGTPQHCLAMVEKVRAAGVDEIASLIDFGIDTGAVLDHLPYLDTLRQLAGEEPSTASEPIAALMERHGVTHLQCTPSMMRMLLAEPGVRSQLAALNHLMIGGEAFPPDLARELGELVGGKVTNMYGPTETTIWSAIHEVVDTGGPVPLGTPLANQKIVIMDSRQHAMPPGVPGEIVIGGAGVVRGYLWRPELTAERFVSDPLDRSSRLYRTGDLGRRRLDGTLEYLGRLDHQVKIRGHRIELGEIEALLHEVDGVDQAVVSAVPEESGGHALVAYVTPSPAGQDFNAIRELLRARLPEFMIPSHYVGLPALPRTPNGKIDRNALPRPDRSAPVSPQAFLAPQDGMETRIAAIWRDVLKLDTVGSLDNFFDAGGHSLLAVQMHRRLTSELGCDLALTDIFRFPTIGTLAAHLADASSGDAAARAGHERAQGRRAALMRRTLARAPAVAGDRSQA